MSGPVKFWSGLALLLLAGAAYLFYTSGPRVARGGGAAAAPPAQGVEDQAAPAPPAAAPQGAPAATPQLSPIQRKMAAWAQAYRENVSPIAGLIAIFEKTAMPGRSTCNALITAAYGAKSELPPAPDSDVDSAARTALDHFSQAGKFCLQEQPGLQDTYLLMGRASIGLAEGVLSERYSQPGVPGLAEPMAGGTEIGRRAVEFARQHGRG